MVSTLWCTKSFGFGFLASGLGEVKRSHQSSMICAPVLGFLSENFRILHEKGAHISLPDNSHLMRSQGTVFLQTLTSVTAILTGRLSAQYANNSAIWRKVSRMSQVHQSTRTESCVAQYPLEQRKTAPSLSECEMTTCMMLPHRLQMRRCPGSAHKPTRPAQ